jgi:hypothetical protein
VCGDIPVGQALSGANGVLFPWMARPGGGYSAFGEALVTSVLRLVSGGTANRETHLACGVQDIGGALLVPGRLALISANFLEDDRGSAIGTAA